MTYKKLTPPKMECILGNCPAIYENKEKNTYVLVGTRTDKGKIEKETGQKINVGSDEELIEIPKGLLERILKGE